MVDIRDLKSRGPKGPCWFESSSGHHHLLIHFFVLMFGPAACPKTIVSPFNLMGEPINAPARLLDSTVDRFFFRLGRTYQFGQPHDDRHAEDDDENHSDH